MSWYHSLVGTIVIVNRMTPNWTRYTVLTPPQCPAHATQAAITYSLPHEPIPLDKTQYHTRPAPHLPTSLAHASALHRRLPHTISFDRATASAATISFAVRGLPVVLLTSARVYCGSSFVLVQPLRTIVDPLPMKDRKCRRENCCERTFTRDLPPGTLLVIILRIEGRHTFQYDFSTVDYCVFL